MRRAVNQNGIECGNLTCFNQAACRNISNGESRCQCLGGFTGITCGDDFDECRLGDPCLHRGYCLNSFGSYRCKCLDGWSGEHSHCGIKDNSTTDRKCIPGWIGEMCQDRCLNDSMCRETEVCTKRGRGHRCICATGWLGINCTTDINECIRNPCPNNTVCINTKGSYTCNCLSGWTGNNCDQDINECSVNPCKHSSTCMNALGYYNCTCARGWKGQNCHKDIDECAKKPCNISLQCINNPGSYTCTYINKQEMQDKERTYIIAGSVTGVLILLIGVIIILIFKLKWKPATFNAVRDDPKQ
ncbi:fibropellin-1-like [Ruditapes philippinarum]|uniref:fibropellin-1-like n=1 Tax=Ruditapes philippinarum TaxID=129788 RepID=UPI00295B96C4|nr:fibropellin-1-like [Ruditapes philippinarum]